MGNGQHCLVRKAFTDGLLEQLVCLLVHTCRGLVNAQDLDSMQQGGEARVETVTYLRFPTRLSTLCSAQTSLQPPSSLHTSLPLASLSHPHPPPPILL